MSPAEHRDYFVFWAVAGLTVCTAAAAFLTALAVAFAIYLGALAALVVRYLRP